MRITIGRAALIAAASLGLVGCSSYYDDYYGGGYSRVALGYSSGYYQPYYGWYDGYYYPGTGYYIYDPFGTRHRWNDRYRSYWEARRPSGNYRYSDNWNDYWREFRQDRREIRREIRRDRRDDRGDHRRERRRR